MPGLFFIERLCRIFWILILNVLFPSILNHFGMTSLFFDGILVLTVCSCLRIFLRPVASRQTKVTLIVAFPGHWSLSKWLVQSKFVLQTKIYSHTDADALASLNKLHVLRGHSWPLTFRQEVHPPPFPASSLCFNEAPGRFWKALELNAVHPFQTAASSSGPSEPWAKPDSAPCLLAAAAQTGLWLQQMSWRACNKAATIGSASGQLQARPSRRIPEPCRESDSSRVAGCQLAPAAFAT